MRKLYTRTIIVSSGRECVLIVLFQFSGIKVGLFGGNWIGQYDLPNLHIGWKTNPVLI